VTGQTVQASQHNPPLEDLASSMTNSLPRNGAAPMTGNLPMSGFRVTGMADGINATDAATKQQAEASGVPIGGVVEFAGAVAPVGWLLCYGQAISRVTFAALFTAIGTAHGSGDGSTTFNIPDYRGRVGAGKDNMGGSAANRMTAATVNGATLGAAGGTETHVLTAAQLAAHTHGPGTLVANTAGAHTHTMNMTTSGDDNPGGGNSRISTSGGDSGFVSVATFIAANSNGDHTHTLGGATAAAGTDAAHLNVQPTIIMNKIIRTG
jgi:microcystin-dependent protein